MLHTLEAKTWIKPIIITKHHLRNWRIRLVDVTEINNATTAGLLE